MKKTIAVLLMFFLVIIPTIAHSVEYSICGLNVKNSGMVEDFSLKDFGEFVLGAVTSIIVHELSHLVTMEIVGADYHWSSLTTSTYWNVSDSEACWIGRSGFLGQNIVNLGLSKWKKKSDFTAGYTIVNVAGTLTYPIRNPDMGDLRSINESGGSADLEWAIFSGIALYNIFTIEW